MVSKQVHRRYESFAPSAERMSQSQLYWASAVVSLKWHDADLASRLRAKSGGAEQFLFASGIADLALCGYLSLPKNC